MTSRYCLDIVKLSCTNILKLRTKTIKILFWNIFLAFFSQQYADGGVMARMAILKPRSSSKYFKNSCLYEVKEIVNLLDTAFYTKKNQYSL